MIQNPNLKEKYFPIFKTVSCSARKPKLLNEDKVEEVMLEDHENSGQTRLEQT